jgi:hypothetical protein
MNNALNTSPLGQPAPPRRRSFRELFPLPSLVFLFFLSCFVGINAYNIITARVNWQIPPANVLTKISGLLNRDQWGYPSTYYLIGSSGKKVHFACWPDISDVSCLNRLNRGLLGRPVSVSLFYKRTTDPKLAARASYILVEMRDWNGAPIVRYADRAKELEAYKRHEIRKDSNPPIFSIALLLLGPVTLLTILVVRISSIISNRRTRNMHICLNEIR